MKKKDMVAKLATVLYRFIYSVMFCGELGKPPAPSSWSDASSNKKEKKNFSLFPLLPEITTKKFLFKNEGEKKNASQWVRMAV